MNKKSTLSIRKRVQALLKTFTYQQLQHAFNILPRWLPLLGFLRTDILQAMHDQACSWTQDNVRNKRRALLQIADLAPRRSALWFECLKGAFDLSQTFSQYMKVYGRVSDLPGEFRSQVLKEASSVTETPDDCDEMIAIMGHTEFLAHHVKRTLAWIKSEAPKCYAHWCDLLDYTVIGSAEETEVLENMIAFAPDHEQSLAVLHHPRMQPDTELYRKALAQAHKNMSSANNLLPWKASEQLPAGESRIIEFAPQAQLPEPEQLEDTAARVATV